MSNAPDTTKTAIDDIFSQLGHIQYLRDRLAHNGAFPELRHGTWWFGTSNYIIVREAQDREELYFTIEMLLDAASDLEDAWEHLDRALHPDIWAEVDAQLQSENPLYVDHKSRGSWRYKPSALERESPKSRSSRKRQPRPRQASPE